MNNRTFSKLKERLISSSFFKDSFWAVGGNGLGSGLLLLSGILIARLLGKDLYGEYGMVKTTMFLLALFSTFALGDTSTKYIAEYVKKDKTRVRELIKDSLQISLITSLAMSIALVAFAQQLADFINAPQLVLSFRFLGLIIVVRSLNTVASGILGGVRYYKQLGVYNVISGIVMLITCIPLTYYFSLSGALLSLVLSQFILTVLTLKEVWIVYRTFPIGQNIGYIRELLVFSFPFALNELIFSISSWGKSLLLTKYSSLGELGMYSAASQWFAIVLVIPGLLGNVILSYLSSSAAESSNTHNTIIKRMLLANFVSTLIPLVGVALCSGWITDYYGPTFAGMQIVLLIAISGAVFACMSRVYQSALMSENRKWAAFGVRSSYNAMNLVISFIVLKFTDGVDAARNMALVGLFVNFLSLILYIGVYYSKRKSPSY